MTAAVVGSIAPRALHERVAGAALRAAALSLGLFLPATPLLLREGAGVVGVLHAYSLTLGLGLAVFLLERRDATWPSVLARVALASALTAALSPFVAAWVRNLGEAHRAFRELDDLLRHDLDVVPGLALAAFVTAPAWSLLPLVRACTTRVGPQVLAGVANAGGVLLPGLVAPPSHLGACGVWAVGVLASGALGALAVALVDRHGLDPAAPRPGPGSPLGRVLTWASLAPVALLGGMVVVQSLLTQSCGGYSTESSAIDSLKTIATAQTMFSQVDADRDATQDHAPGLHALGARENGALIDPRLAGGVKAGYVFRTARSEVRTTDLWCAAADPVHPGRTGDRRFWLNQAGQIFQAPATEQGPAPLDPDGPGPPSGWDKLGARPAWRPVGR